MRCLISRPLASSFLAHARLAEHLAWQEPLLLHTSLFSTDSSQDHHSASTTPSANNHNNRSDKNNDTNSKNSHTAEQQQTLSAVIRSSLLAEEAIIHLWRGRAALSNSIRPDLQHLADREEEMHSQVEDYAHEQQQQNQKNHQHRHHQLRPSVLSPLVSLGGFALGAAAAILPPKASAAVLAGVQSALTDTYNENLRQLHEVGLAQDAEDLRTTLREARDIERVPETGGVVNVPDILALRRLNELSVEEGIAAVVGAGAKAILGLSRKI